VVMNSKGFFFSFMAVVLITSVFLLSSVTVASVLSEEYDVRVSDDSFRSSVSLIDSLEEAVLEDALGVASYHALNELSCYIEENGFFDSYSEFDSLLSSLIWKGSFKSVESLPLVPGERTDLNLIDVPADAVLVNSAQDLDNMRNDLDGNFVLGRDIDLSGFDSDSDSSNGNWIPIGNNSNRFIGELYGNSYSITGLNVSLSGVENVGLFGVAENANISNVHISGVIVGGKSSGGLIGRGFAISVVNSSFDGSVNSSANFAGGLIGRAQPGSSFVNVSSSGSVYGSTTYAGGLIGNFVSSSIVNSSSSSDVSSGGSYAGGLLGRIRSNSFVNTSFSSGDVFATGDEVGGLIGSVSNSNVSSSFSSSSVSSTGDTVGGLIGNIGYSNVSFSFSSGSVSSTGKRVGGFIGSWFGTFDATYCNKNYWDNVASDQSSSGGSGCVVGKSTSELQSPTSNNGIYADWDSNIWDFGASTEYPSLNLTSFVSRKALVPLSYSSSGVPFGGGDGSVGSPFVVVTGEHLNNVRSNLSAHYVLVEDVDLLADGFSGWVPIGSVSDPFTGSFDGRGFVVHNLVISSSGDGVGLFGWVENASFSDFGVNNGRVVSSGSKVGGFIGSGVNSSLSNLFFSGSVEGNDDVGGLIGFVSSSVVNGSFSSGSVEGSKDVGGLVGDSVSGSSFSNSYSLSSVSGSSGVGGFIGSSGGSSVSFSYFSGDVTSSGTVGFVGSGSVSGCNSVFSNVVSSSSLNSICGVKVSESSLRGPVSCGVSNDSSPNSRVSGSVDFGSWDGEMWYFGDNFSLPVLRDSGREVGYSFGRSAFSFADLIRETSGHSLTFYLNESVVSVSQDSPWVVKSSYPVDFSLRFGDHFWRRNISVGGETSIEGIFDPLFLGLKSADDLPSGLSSKVSGELFIPVSRSKNISSLSSSSDKGAVLREFIVNSEYFDPGSRAPAFLDRYFGNLNMSSGRFCSDLVNGCGVEMILNPSSSGSFDFDSLFEDSYSWESAGRSFVGWCFFSDGLCLGGVSSVGASGFDVVLDNEFHRGIYDTG